MAEQVIEVIFRVWKNGDVIALFPYVPADRYSYDCNSYEHNGQHGAASPEVVYRTRLAKPAEYAALKRELESIGYALRVIQRFPNGSTKRYRAAYTEVSA
jgi:hypothetical protein